MKYKTRMLPKGPPGGGGSFGKGPVFETFIDGFWSQNVPKTQPKSIKQVNVFRMLFRDRCSSTFDRTVITFGTLLKIILMICATFENHENDVPVKARASF